jgi:hypothetical protein
MAPRFFGIERHRDLLRIGEKTSDVPAGAKLLYPKRKNQMKLN